MARSKAKLAKKAGTKASKEAPVLPSASTTKYKTIHKFTYGTKFSECTIRVPDMRAPIGSFLTKKQQKLEAAAGAAPEIEVIDLEPEEVPSTSSAASESAGIRLVAANVDVLEKQEIVQDCDGEKDPAAAKQIDAEEIPKVRVVVNRTNSML